VYATYTPKLLRWIYPTALWCLPSDSEKVVHLTFDDGPSAGITNKVLDILDTHDVKASFFCIGNHVKKHPELFSRIKESGHVIGNHSQSHLDGSKSDTAVYLSDVRACDEVVQSTLFRPPYGRLKRSQYKELKQQFDIIMWDVLSGDFDPKLSPENCLSNVLKNVRNGSIILMHDHAEAGTKTLRYLDELIIELKKKGFTLKTLPCK
jgi:peptidoglycan/xylan/chitin deacetylase (PgdA/CDA1 family)